MAVLFIVLMIGGSANSKIKVEEQKDRCSGCQRQNISARLSISAKLRQQRHDNQRRQRIENLPAKQVSNLIDKSSLVQINRRGLKAIGKCSVCLIGAKHAAGVSRRLCDAVFNQRRKPGRVQRCRCLLYTSPSPRDRQKSRMPSSA